MPCIFYWYKYTVEIQESDLGLFYKEFTMPQPDQKYRYHGFTCLKCQGHLFGTGMNEGRRYLDLSEKAIIGKCLNFVLSKEGIVPCGFVWNRESGVEQKVMFDAPYAVQWNKDYAAWRKAEQQRWFAQRLTWKEWCQERMLCAVA